MLPTKLSKRLILLNKQSLWTTTLSVNSVRLLHMTHGLQYEQGTKPELPDYNTDVNVHTHKLTRPTKPPPRWVGLKDLKTRTKVCIPFFTEINVRSQHFLHRTFLVYQSQSKLRPPHRVLKAYQLPPTQCCFIAICICIKPSQTYGPVWAWSLLPVIA